MKTITSLRNSLMLITFLVATTTISANESSYFTEKQDSIVIPGISKQIFDYDANGNKTLDVSCYWDSYYNVWINSSKYEYSYNDNGLQTLKIEYINLNDNEWDAYRKFETVYDSDGNKTHYSTYYWNSNIEEWVGIYKEEISYNSGGNQTLYISFEWDNSIKNWKGRTKTEYSYDEMDNMILRIVYNGYFYDNSTIWTGYLKNEYSYDDDNQMIVTIYEWNRNRDEWVFSGKSKSVNETNGNQILQLVYFWDIDDNWTYSNRTESSYDDNGNQTLYAYYEWDNNIENWIGITKEEYCYDSNSNLLSDIKFFWNSNECVWSAYTKTENSYDSYGNKILFASYTLNSFSNNNMINYKVEYSYDNSVSGETIMGLGSGSKLLSCLRTEFDPDGNPTREITYNYFYSPAGNSDINNVSTDMIGCKRIISLDGKCVRNMLSGHVYINGNTKIMIK